MPNRIVNCTERLTEKLEEKKKGGGEGNEKERKGGGHYVLPKTGANNIRADQAVGQITRRQGRRGAGGLLARCDSPVESGLVRRVRDAISIRHARGKKIIIK